MFIFQGFMEYDMAVLSAERICNALNEFFAEEYKDKGGFKTDFQCDINMMPNGHALIEVVDSRNLFNKYCFDNGINVKTGKNMDDILYNLSMFDPIFANIEAFSIGYKNDTHIKFHDNKNGAMYGEDGKLTDNWKAEDHTGKYFKVYFRVETVGYGYPDFYLSPENRQIFEEVVGDMFGKMGFKTKDEKITSCSVITRGNEALYLHPQDFSGIVKAESIKEISNALSKSHYGVKSRGWVDIYEEAYVMDARAFNEYLESKRPEMEDKLLEYAYTKRKNSFLFADGVAYATGKEFGFNRIGEDDMKTVQKISEYVQNKIIPDLIKEGKLKTYTKDESLFIRSLLKSEQKKSKQTERE